MKKLKTNKQLNAALDKLQKEFNEFKKGRSQNAPTPENLKPSKSGELEKQKEDIRVYGNFVTHKIYGGLFKVVEKDIREDQELITIRCCVLPSDYAWSLAEESLIKINRFKQAPDSMIFDYLMKGYREKGWKEGCRVRVKNGKEYEEYTVTEFRLRKENNEYKVAAIVDNSVFYLLLDECTLLPEKLTFAGEIIELAYDEYHKEQYLELDTYANRAYKEDLKFFKDHLIPERKAEVERILKAMEE